MKRIFLVLAILFMALVAAAAPAQNPPPPVISPEVHADRRMTFRFRGHNDKEVAVMIESVPKPLAEHVGKALEKANTRLYTSWEALHLEDSPAQTEKQFSTAVCNEWMEKEKLAPRARFELATLRLTALCLI
jgi:hypothetical protein